MATEIVPLGKLIADPAQKRDAFHVACTPAVAMCILLPGTRVMIQSWKDEADGSRTPVVCRPHKTEDEVGIVDPFLASPVEPGQRVFVCLFPNTVTGMRHAWVCPAIPPEDAGGAAYEQQLKRAAIVATIPGHKRS